MGSSWDTPIEFEPISVLLEDSCGVEDPLIHDFMNHLWPAVGTLPTVHGTQLRGAGCNPAMSAARAEQSAALAGCLTRIPSPYSRHGTGLSASPPG